MGTLVVSWGIAWAHRARTKKSAADTCGDSELMAPGDDVSSATKRSWPLGDVDRLSTSL